MPCFPGLSLLVMLLCLLQGLSPTLATLPTTHHFTTSNQHNPIPATNMLVSARDLSCTYPQQSSPPAPQDMAACPVQPRPTTRIHTRHAGRKLRHSRGLFRTSILQERCRLPFCLGGTRHPIVHPGGRDEFCPILGLKLTSPSCLYAQLLQAYRKRGRATLHTHPPILGSTARYGTCSLQ